MVWATVVLVSAYALLILFFVFRGARKASGIEDYALGSIAFSPPMVGLSLAASITSAATFIINPGFIALYGLSGILAFGVAMPIGIFASLVILTNRFRSQGTEVKALTMAQWIGKRYGSSVYAMLFGVLSLLLITFLVLIAVGMTKVLSKALNADEILVLGVLLAFVFGYMMFGGANSMVYTNTIQAVLMIVVAFILLGSGYPHFSAGVKGFWQQLEQIDPMLVAIPNPESFLFRDYFETVVCSLVVGIAVVCQPHIITKSLLLKEEKEVNRYLLTAIIVLFLFFLVIVAGLYARLRFPDLTVSGEALKMDGIIPAYVVEEFPVYIGLIVIMGLISAGLSTLEGLIQTVPTSITSDIIAPLLPEGYTRGDAGTLMLDRINKGVIILIGLATFYLSKQQLINPSLSVGIFAQNGVYAYFSAAFVPVLLGIFFRGVPLIAPVAASLVALTVHFSVYYGRIGPYMQAEVRNPAVAVTFAILASAAVGFGLYALLRKKKKAVAMPEPVKTKIS